MLLLPLFIKLVYSEPVCPIVLGTLQTELKMLLLLGVIVAAKLGKANDVKTETKKRSFSLFPWWEIKVEPVFAKAGRWTQAHRSALKSAFLT